MSELIVKRLQTQDRKRYGILDMRTIEDDRLSLASVGLLLYLVSRPEGWQISRESIAAQMKAGKAAVQTCMNELQTFGYLDIEKVKGDDHAPVRTVWTVHEVSQKHDIRETRSESYQAGNQLDTETKSTKGIEANNNKVISIEAYQVENRLDTETRSESYQAGNQLDTPYQAGNRLDVDSVESQSGQGSFHQAENRLVLKKNMGVKKEHSPATDKPLRGKKSSSQKSPAQKPGEDCPGEVYRLMDYLKAAKKAQGVTDIAFDGRWRGQSKAAGKELLESGLSVEDVKACIDFLLESPFYGPGTVSLLDVKRKLPVYQAQSLAGRGKTETQDTGTHGASYTDDMDEIDRFLADQKAMFAGCI